MKEAVSFASHYQNLVYCAHALEILLHSIVEEDVSSSRDRGSSEDGSQDLLTRTIEFLDHFEASLDIVVGCARKIEMTRWPRLFDVVGNPKSLFEVCISHICYLNSDSNLLSIGLSGFRKAKDGSFIFISPSQPRAAPRRTYRCRTSTTDCNQC